MKKRSSLTCPDCHEPFHHRTKRSWFMKNILFFMPFKVYFCDKCDKDVYMLFTAHHAEKQAA